MAINIQRLALRFQEATGCSQPKAQKHTKEYLSLCGIAMLRDHFTDQSGSKYYINQTQIQNDLGGITVNGNRYYDWQTFQSFPERVFNIVQKGSNITEKLSMATSRYTMEEVLLAAGTPTELWNEIYKKQYEQEIRTNDYDVVPVNLVSLANYIQSNLSNDRDNPKTSAKEIEALDRNLKHAQKIYMLAEAGGGELVQICNPSSFGRMYYKGPNLQNTPKIVRHAALGDCHEYDIESSVFAWKLSWFRAICKEHNKYEPKPATLEYLDHKKAIRNRLAQTVFGSNEPGYVKIIKEFVTAIGFGAPLRGNGYIVNTKYQKPALAEIIKSKTKLDIAMADPWVKEFYQEQNDMNDALVAMTKVNMLQELQQVPELWEKGAKKLKPNSVVSYLYQHAEKEILDWVEEFCNSSEVLLTVHDCIYTRRPVKLAELKAGLQGFGEYYKLSHEQHQPWTWQEPVDKSDPFYDPREHAKLPVRKTPRVIEGLYDGSVTSSEYQADSDPFLDDMTDQQRRRYLDSRPSMAL